MTPSDIKRIAELAVPHLERIVIHFLPGGKIEGHEYVALNPKRADNSIGSFSINLDSGQWADFATGDKGGDVVSLVAYLNGGNQGKAAEEIASFLGVDDAVATQEIPNYMGTDNKIRTPTQKAWTPIVPIPADAPSAPSRHPKHGSPSSRWDYRDKAGAVLCYICRFETTTGKQFAPQTYCRDAAGNRSWRWQGLEAPRPLYNLHRLAQYPEATIIVCEGEKSADAAAVLFPLPGYVTTSPMNGAQSPHKTDWTPLAQRTVWIWLDNDEPGRGFVKAVAELLSDASSVYELRLDYFKRLPDGTERVLPDKWDAADAVTEGFTAEHINNVFLKDSANLIDRRRKPEPAADKDGESPYRIIEWRKGNKNGVYFTGDEEERWICDPLRITAQACDETGNCWGRLLEFSDPAGNKHQWAMPMRILAGDCTELRERLLDAGLSIAPGRKARELLTQYIQTASPKEFACCVERIGWHRGAFVFPDGVIGAPTAGRVLLQTSGPPTAIYNPAGTLEEWRREVAALCVGNSRLVFAVSTGFAAFLLEMTGDENGGFHYRGQSSIGKTIALAVAASLFGCKDYLQRWRATINGLEAVAVIHNDTLLILDEMSQIDAREAGDVAYMLANGRGKHRANRHGGARPAATWRLLFLSSGEISLAAHMRAAGKKAHAGQETRLVDIPADTGTFGVFENLHDCANGADFALKLATATRTLYGTAARNFLQKLTAADLEASKRTIEELIKDFIAEHLPADASGQALRIARRFALVAAGGELATAFGVTGWPVGEAIGASAACFKACLAARGGAGPQETELALSQVRLFFEQHGESRFTPWEDDSKPTINRAGFRRNTENGQEFYVFPEVFKAEICKGLDARFVAKLLVDRNLIRPDKDGRFQSRHRVPGMGNKRVYHFASAIMGGEE